MDASILRSSALTPSRSATATAVAAVPEIHPQFFKTAVQDLNNPITTIKAALTLLNSSGLKSEQRQRYLQMIGQACDSQSQLINHVFTLLELQLIPKTAALEKVQLWDLVPGVVSTYQPLAQENNILLAYTVAAHLPPILAIEAYLKQVLVSLLSNSIQFTNGNGRIWVNAHQRADKKVALVIQDHGCDIMPAALPQMFNSFYRGTADGSSLGLTLMEQLLAHCKASISVSRSPGQGVTFTILLSTEAD
ncbi:MAG: HAMP domain-containing sensor histidine kinase [Cyanobacteria bacterium P01_B01_bin.77]